MSDRYLAAIPLNMRSRLVSAHLRDGSVGSVDGARAQSQRTFGWCWRLAFARILRGILLPVLIAPLILLGYTAGPPIESTAPQALIYGWVLQFGIALVPYIARKYFLKQEKARLGGSWLSLAAITLGSILVWVSIFLIPM